VENVTVPSESEPSSTSWKHRHGATIIVVTVVAMLASLMTFQKSC
jgi:hypothetical protein